METKMEEATLHTIARGALLEQWKEALGTAAVVFSEATSRVDCPYEAPKDIVTVKVKIEVELSYDMVAQTSSVAARLNVEKPKRRWAAGGIFCRNRQWSVANEGEQMRMFGGTLHAIPSGKDEASNGE